MGVVCLRLYKAIGRGSALRHSNRRRWGFATNFMIGEVVLVPPAKPAHFTVQWRIVALLSQAFARDGEVRAEVPYRPAIDEQFWIADVAFLRFVGG